MIIDIIVNHESIIVLLLLFSWYLICWFLFFYCLRLFVLQHYESCVIVWPALQLIGGVIEDNLLAFLS